MGILDNLGDKAVEKISKKETIRLPFEQMAKLVKEEFIMGADDEFLSAVNAASKGGTFRVKELKSKNERYDLRVEGLSWNILDLLGGRRKIVWIFDNETNKFYQLDKDRRWKKFYKEVSAAIKMEKINRSR